MNTDLRKKIFKLINISAFGKTMENVRKHRYIKLVTTERRNYLVSEPNYHTKTFFTEHLLTNKNRPCNFQLIKKLKDFSAQHCLVSMLEKWKSATDNKKLFGALLTDLSKAFDCLSHELLIAETKCIQI